MPTRRNIQTPSPKKAAEVKLVLERPGAREVYLCGDFNQWATTCLPMIRHGANGHWEKRLTLPPGRYEYKFIVDGVWLTDPNASHTVPNRYGSSNSVLEVGP